MTAERDPLVLWTGDSHPALGARLVIGAQRTAPRPNGPNGGGRGGRKRVVVVTIVLPNGKQAHARISRAAFGAVIADLEAAARAAWPDVEGADADADADADDDDDAGDARRSSRAGRERRYGRDLDAQRRRPGVPRGRTAP